MRKCKLIILCVILSFALSACANTPGVETQVFQKPTEELVPYTGAYLHSEIPAPTDADVFVFTEGEDREYFHYAFTFENFTLAEAEQYVLLLEKNLACRRKLYEIYTKNDFPMFNYIGELDGGVSISLSQCNTSGGILINVEKG